MSLNFLAMFKAKTVRFRIAIWQSNNIGYKVIRPIYKLVRFTYYFCFNKVYRNDRITSLKYSRHYHQPNSATSFNRYPDLFSLCRDYFMDDIAVKILSFGCSTGEEVFSLNKYLPQAQIVGVDINHYNLRQAGNKYKQPNISFVHSLSKEYLASVNYSAIFCLAVLQHTQNRNPLQQQACKFTFQKFNLQIIQLDSKLNIGGLFFIDQCDFNFLDTVVSKKYSPLAAPNNRILRDRPLYSSNNFKIAEQTNNYRVFVKNKA